jgi:hypothetical protein
VSWRRTRASNLQAYRLVREDLQASRKELALSATLDECRLAHVLKEEIYKYSGAGCCWHVVLDDMNVETSFVEYTIARDVPECRNKLNACREIGPLILKMSITQRKKLASGGYEGK